MGRPNVHWLDAGETATLKYGCFLLDAAEGVTGVHNVAVSDSEIAVKPIRDPEAPGDADTPAMRVVLSGGARFG